MIHLSGVEGSGKSTVAAILGDNTQDYCKEVDNLVDNINCYELDEIDIPEKVVILTADYSVIRSRIEHRKRDKRINETPRSIYYYDARYRDVAKYFGIPVIDTTGKTPDQVADVIKNMDWTMYQSSFRNLTPEKVRASCRLIDEGESKQIYADPFNTEYCYIILNDTTYTHCNGEIASIGTIRAKGTRYFLDMLRRNCINHAYVTINNHGVIYSKRMFNITKMEVVVKDEYSNHNDHSYYKYRDHGVECENGPTINYRVRDKYSDCSDFDDNASIITSDNIKELLLKLFHTIRYHLLNCGIIIKEGSFMFSEENDGQCYFWNEINQDCMKLIMKKGRYEKEFEEKVMERWKKFNSIMEEYFVKNIYNPVNYWEFDYYKSMMDMEVNKETNNGEIYMKILSEGNRRFVVIDNITTCFPDKVVNFNADILKLYHKYHPHVICSNVTDAYTAIDYGARRVFVMEPNQFENNQTIVIERGTCSTLERITRVKNVGTIDFLEYTMLNSKKYLKVFQLCTTCEDVEKSWLLGAVPIISEEMAQTIWKATISTMYPTLIVQNNGGTIKEVVKDYCVFELDTDRYEEVSINTQTYDSIVVTVDDPGQSESFSFQASAKSNLIELQKITGTNKKATQNMIKEITEFNGDSTKLFYLFLQHLNNKGENIVQIINKTDAITWDSSKFYDDEE